MNAITPLPTLAQNIKEKHSAALEAATNAVNLAKEAGGLLIQAKGQVNHGEWADWLKANVAFSERTAQGYMRQARQLPKLDGEKAQRVAGLPLREALKALADREEHRVEYDPEIDAARIILDIQDAIRDWNASAAILLGEVDGDINLALLLFHQLEWKCAVRMDCYREGLHRLASAGVSYASPLYQAALKAVSEMESLGRDLAEIRT